MEKLLLGENKVIVFYYCINFILISILLLVVVLSFSLITVEVEKLKIDNAHAITAIINNAIEKEPLQIIDNIEILARLKIKIFNILPITILTINNKKIKKAIKKNIGKMQLPAKKKELIKSIATDIICNHIQINKININIELGLNNAYYTALASAISMIIIAIGLNLITEDRIKIYKDEQKQEKYIDKNFKYNVDPVYSEKVIFSLAICTKITIKTLSIIKKLLMYKSNLFVNNTNKYKVKES